MTKPVPIAPLGGIGIAPDPLPFSLPTHAFTFVENVFFDNGMVGKAPGWIEYDFEVETPFTEDQLWFQTWRAAGVVRTVFCGESALSVWDGSTLSAPTIGADLAASTTLGTTTEWDTSIFGNHVIANNKVSTPRYSLDGGTFNRMPGFEEVFGAGATAQGVIAYRGFLFAYGVNGDDFTLYWSHESPLDSFPQSWDYTDPTKLAGFDIVLADDGPIVGARVLQNRLLVYTQSATYAATLGGAYIFQLDRLFSYGVAAQHAVVDLVGSQHLVVGEGALYRHQGGVPNRFAHHTVEGFFFGTLTDTTKVACAAKDDGSDALVYYASDGNAEKNAALVWAWIGNTWSRFKFPFDIFCIAESLQGGPITAWEDLVSTWESESRSWASMLQTDARRKMMLLGARAWYQLGVGYTRSVDGVDEEYPAYAERLFLDLQSVFGSSIPINHVREIYPRIQGSGLVDFQIGFSLGPNDPPTWTPKQTFDLDAGGEYKVPARVTGRWFHWRVGSWEAPYNPGNWALDSVEWEVEGDGIR